MLHVKIAVVFVFAMAAVACYLRLAAGPINLDEYTGRFAAALAGRIGPGWSVALGEIALELHGTKPAVSATALEVRNPAGVAVVRAPYALVSLDPVALLTGDISPREIELRDLHLRGTIAKDGTLSILPQGEPPPPFQGAAAGTPAAPRTSGPTAAGPSAVAVAVASLLDPVVRSTSLIGALERASIIGASLTLVGPDGRDRAAFDKVDAVFERLEGDDRRIDVTLQGQSGPWRLRGRVHGGVDRAAEIEADGVPLGDVLLLSGRSSAPAVSDLRLTGRVLTTFKDGRLARLDGRVESSAGSVTRTGLPPLRIDRMSARASWDETAGALNLDAVDIDSEGTRVRLAGRLARASEAVWRLTLAGRDAVIAGLAPREPAFRLGEIAIEAGLGERVFTLDRLALKGEGVDVGVSGTLELTDDGPTVRGVVEASDTDARRLVRLWPDAANIPLRSYMAERMTGGRVESLVLRSVLDQADFRAAFSPEPFTDGALDLRMSTRGVTLDVVDGLPPLRGLTLKARASGTRATMTASDGYAEMPDGRRLGFPELSFVHRSLDRPGTPAEIAFRLAGGVDALASFLKAPIFRDGGVPDLDPATMRGQADIRVRLPLVPGKIPPLGELALSLSGTLSDVAVDKLPGKEKLEGGTFAVSGEAGGLTVRGEGRLSGSPASFELQSPRAGVGELVVSTVLDEAARNRRALPVAPLLAGPLPVKVVVGLGARAPTRVEVDLAKAAIDGLVPGWVKPAGKPGRMSFTLGEGEATELRDLQLDAAPVQVRGQLVLAPGGGLERADLPVFKLSPGDDLKAQLERGPNGVMRISLKGNNGDARPILKWVTTGSARPASREPQEVEIDLGLNILSGFNDEALTGVAAKVAARGSELKAVQFSGRFRSAAVEAQLVKRDSGAPILAIRSADAGSTLRFLDLYRRMVGGQLTVDARWAESQQEGRVTIDEFGLRGEPALARIASTAAQQAAATDERGLAPIARADTDQVLFTRLTTDFRKTGSRIDYQDAVIYGSQVGFNLNGWVDHARDRLDIGGTFVPAFMLNNAFSQLPVIGLLLGGGRHEGLIAVDFRVSGTIGNPNLTVNPLTAVAPGILRKLFGWMLPEGEAPAEPARQQARPRRSER